MANDNTLAIRLEARIRDFEKNMARASKSAGREFGSIEKRAQASAAKLKGHFADFGKGLLAGIAAGGVAGIVSQIGSIAKGVALVGQEAKRAGISAKAFQELGYVAQQNGVSLDALIDGFKELNLRADEWIVTGKGPAAEAFTRLGYTADELKAKLKDPSALFTEIIGKLQKLDTAAQIRIADEIFGGTGGEQFVRFIERGEQGIRDTIAEANRLGIVMDDQLLAKAALLDQEFQKVTTTVGTALKTAIVEAASALSNFIKEFQSFDQKYQARLNAHNAGASLGGMVQPEGSVLTTSTRDRPTALDARMGGALYPALTEADNKLIEALRKRYTAAAVFAAASPSTGGSKAAKDTFDPDPEAFRNMLGYTESYVEAQQLANEKLEYFGDLATGAANSLATAFADGKLEASELLGIIGQIARELLTVEGIKMIASLFGGGIGLKDGGFASTLGLASGGPVRGPGGPRSDSVPAMLSNGEFVVNAKAASKYAGLLEGINSGSVPRFANGGPVVAPYISPHSRGGGGGGGTTVVELRLSPEITAQILAEARGQSIKISQDITKQGLAGYDKGKRRQQMTGG